MRLMPSITYFRDRVALWFLSGTLSLLNPYAICSWTTHEIEKSAVVSNWGGLMRKWLCGTVCVRYLTFFSQRVRKTLREANSAKCKAHVMIARFWKYLAKHKFENYCADLNLSGWTVSFPPHFAQPKWPKAKAKLMFSVDIKCVFEGS